MSVINRRSMSLCRDCYSSSFSTEMIWDELWICLNCKPATISVCQADFSLFPKAVSSLDPGRAVEPPKWSCQRISGYPLDRGEVKHKKWGYPQERAIIIKIFNSFIEQTGSSHVAESETGRRREDRMKGRSETEGETDGQTVVTSSRT